jgi:DNA-binding CsgD family transcriptional regulator
MKVILREPDEIDIKIVKMCAEGLTAKEIGYEINLKSKAVAARIEVMKKYYECKSIAHLVTHLSSLGKIPL